MNTAEKIKVMQAYLEGKQLQVKYQNHQLWGNHADTEPYWDWRIYDYRIKPTPEFRIYLAMEPGKWLRDGSFSDPENAKQYGELMLMKIDSPWKYYKVEEA